MLFSRSSSACGGVACLRVVMIAQYFKAIWMQSLFHLPILTNNGHTVSFRPLLSDSYFMITKWSIKMNKNRLITAALRCALLIFEGAMCNYWLYTLKDVMTLFKIVYSYICVINLAMSWMYSDFSNFYNSNAKWLQCDHGIICVYLLWTTQLASIPAVWI